ncbi:MAG TPA: MFS transporter [Mycobacteriales bacterium]|nr:MFS transporter [Mycobacteriales bacterium]
MTLTDTGSSIAGRARSIDHRWLALGVIGTAQLMIVLDASIVTIALPHAQESLHISNSDRQWVQTAYTLTFGGLLLLGGRVADYFGRKRTFLIGLLGFASASALGGMAQSPGWLFGARALQGGIAALLAPAVLSLITTTFTGAKDRAKAFAVYGAISGTGGAIGLIAGGVLTEYLSWRWTLFVNVPIAIAVFFAAIPLLHESRAEGDRRYDLVGAALATVGLALLVYGFSNASTHSWTAPVTVGCITVAVVLLAGFVLWELYGAANPLLPMRIVLDRNRGGAYLSFFLATLGMFAVFLFLTYYMQLVHGWTPLKSGFAFLPFPLGVITSATIASRTLPRLGPRPLALGGFLVASAGMFWLTQLQVDSGYLTHLAPSMLLISLGMGQVFVSMSSTALIGVPQHDAGVASAMVNTMQQVGGSLGVAFLNTIATTATATYAAAHVLATPGESMTHGFTKAFAFSTAVMLIAALVVGLLIRAGRSDVAPAGGNEPETEAVLAPAVG